MPRKPVGQAPITSETMAYLHCWHKADEQGEFLIPCESKTEATRIKFLLYRSAKQFYASPELKLEYPQFARARQNCSVGAHPDDAGNWFVRVYRSDKKREVAKLIDRLGLTNADLQVPQPQSEVRLEQALTPQLPPQTTQGASCIGPGTKHYGSRDENAGDRLPESVEKYLTLEREELE